MENFDFLENSEILVNSSPVQAYARQNTLILKPTDKPNKHEDSLIKFSFNFLPGEESFKSVVTNSHNVFFPRLKRSSNRPPLRDLLDNGTQAPNQCYINGQFYNQEALATYIKAENYSKRLLFSHNQTSELYNRQKLLYNRFKSLKSNNYMHHKYPTNNSKSTDSLPNIIINFSNQPRK
ncbi:unnamed protein product [Brachionus calyciflorus]|uniref:Uncharacterized protein n=1 Tax=Brachionus calyciflorus TaxID=104777 RepID=A0A814BE89_9BILA|nr:unnamed protein product [Brachionus calyciflorus]